MCIVIDIGIVDRWVIPGHRAGIMHYLVAGQHDIVHGAGPGALLGYVQVVVLRVDTVMVGCTQTAQRLCRILYLY